jgi:ribose-phosphate pyrophosphokinase
MSKFKLISCGSNDTFAENIAKSLGMNLLDVTINEFSDGEINVKVNESVRGQDVFIVQSTHRPVNKHLMQLLIMCDCLKRSNAKTITAVIPYFGYARQDRKVLPRVPITAKLVADMIQTAGATRVVTMDLHAAQIQGFFNIPVDNLYGTLIFLNYIKDIKLDNIIIASPDVGGVARARSVAKHLNLDIVIIDKRREKANSSEVMNIIGDVDGKNVIMIDDMIDTGGTIVKAAAALKVNGANSVRAFAVHPVLSGNAYENLDNSALDEIIVLDTIPVKKAPKIKVLSSYDIFAQVILRINDDKSVHSLFEV